MSGDGRVAQVTARAHVPTVTMHHYDVLLAAARLALGHNCALFAPFAKDPTQDPPRAASRPFSTVVSQHPKPTRRWTDVLRDEDAWDEVRAVDGDGSWWTVVRDWDAHARARYRRLPRGVLVAEAPRAGPPRGRRPGRRERRAPQGAPRRDGAARRRARRRGPRAAPRGARRRLLAARGRRRRRRRRRERGRARRGRAAARGAAGSAGVLRRGGGGAGRRRRPGTAPEAAELAAARRRGAARVRRRRGAGAARGVVLLAAPPPRGVERQVRGR